MNPLFSDSLIPLLSPLRIDLYTLAIVLLGYLIFIFGLILGISTLTVVGFAAMLSAGIISAELSLGLTADCVDLKIEDENLIQYKPAFGGGIVARITSKTKPEIATVRPGIFLEKVTDREMTIREIYLKNSERYEIVENRIIESKYIPLQQFLHQKLAYIE